MSDNAYALSIPLGILMFILIMTLFHYKDILSNIYFIVVLWIGYPILLFICTFLINTSKEDSNIESCIIGALPSLVFIYIALIISSVDICRIPIVSVFAPFFVKDTYKSKSCCDNKLNISHIEKAYSVVKGISYGFYVMFATFFGIIIGNSYATVINTDPRIMKSRI